jgi:two-component system, sensor histidine kinase RegB
MEIFANARFQEVIVHDLRTPLNVISLALRMVDAATLTRNPELVEDLDMIRSNAAEWERMLVYIVDASRLPTEAAQLTAQAFDPTRLVSDILEEYQARPIAGPVRATFDEVPKQVVLDAHRARMAIQKAMGNALAAAGSTEVLMRVGGGPDRLVIRMEVRVPPRESVRSHDVQPEEFQRVVATPGERRGLDLAIAGRISQLFGGKARLEATPGQGTAVVLDWPIAQASA